MVCVYAKFGKELSITNGQTIYGDMELEVGHQLYDSLNTKEDLVHVYVSQYGGNKR